MLLNSYNLTSLLCSSYYKLLIQRLNGMNIDHLCINTICCQLLGCFHGCCYAKSVCNNGKILTFTKDNTFAKFKLIIWSVIDHRYCQSSKSHIYRAYMLVCSLYHGLCLDIIRWACDNHSRNGTHKCKILTALMGSTILAYGNTTMSSTDLYIKLRIAYRITYLLISTACCKHCKCTGKRYFTGSCETSCNTNHITLCNTTVNMTFRKLLLKDTCLCSCSKVSIQNDQILMFFA